MLESDILIFDIIALEWLIALLAIAVFVIVGGFRKLEQRWFAHLRPREEATGKAQRTARA